MSKKISIPEPKPEGLTIRRDEAGVPHIDALNFEDVLWGGGYAHAIDRSTQLLMMRILGQGRLCELISDNEESLATDRFFRRANWHNNLDQEVKKLDDQTHSLCQSYCDGINAGLATIKISLLKLLGYKYEPWTIQDSILVSRMSSYLTLAQSQAEVERIFIEMVQAGLSFEKLSELFPIDRDNFDQELIQSIELQDKFVPNEVLWNQSLPRIMASNNWVVAGHKTASGAALMANDPHLEVNRLPNVWCEQSLKWGDKYITGMGMPGLPGLMIGRTESIAWGATYTFMDTIDSWVEECKAGKFKQDNKWREFTNRVEAIKRKKHDDHEITFYENQHGVLDGDPNKPGRYLSTRWIASNSGAKSLTASLQVATASDAQQAMEYLGQIESGWNYVISDTSNNIAYQMSGLMPKRHKNWNGFTPAPGWDSKFDWKGVVDTNDLPKCLNPKEGYIVTANQDLNHLGKATPINMPMGKYRASRIEDILAASDNHSVESTKELHFDVYSKQAKLFLDILIPLLTKNKEQSDAFDVLTNWDYRYDLNSIGAPLFETFYSSLRNEVFAQTEGGMGHDVLEHLSKQTGLFIDFYDNFDQAILNENSAWYGQYKRDQIFVKAFNIAKDNYQAKQWKDVNSIPFNNILFQGKLPTFLGFDTKPIPLIGGRATPHQGQIYQSEGRSTSFSPSVRMIADMADSTLHTCLAGGPSDSRFSPFYKSSLKRWMRGEYKILRSELD